MLCRLLLLLNNKALTVSQALECEVQTQAFLFSNCVVLGQVLSVPQFFIYKMGLSNSTYLIGVPGALNESIQ